MKHRNGFVSNSSSSSFILGVKGGLSEDGLKKELFKALKVGIDSPLLPIANSIVASIVRGSKKFTSIQELLDEQEVDCVDDLYDASSETALDLLSKDEKWEVYIGSWYSDGGDVTEMFLCETPINFISENMIFEHDTY